MQPPLEHATHADLVQRVADRGADRDAETEVCRRFSGRIRLYGLKHLRDEDRARELVQLVLVAVIEAMRARRVEQPEQLDRFVLGTCRNLAARVRATETRAIAVEPSVLDELDPRFVMPATEATDFGALIDCIHKLEVRAQSVLHLSFYRDKSADEIASALDTTAGNVRVLRHRAVAQLRDCLGAAA